MNKKTKKCDIYLAKLHCTGQKLMHSTMFNTYAFLRSASDHRLQLQHKSTHVQIIPTGAQIVNYD